MSRNTLIAGAKDLAEEPVLGERIRRPGAGPKRKIDLDSELLVALDSFLEPESRGDPTSPLRWTLKSTRVLAAELTRLGHKVGARRPSRCKSRSSLRSAGRMSSSARISRRPLLDPVGAERHFQQAEDLALKRVGLGR